MLIYCDTDSGTFGVAEDNLIVLDLTEAEVEFLSELADDERSLIFRLVKSNYDQPEYDVYSAHAAMLAEREDRNS